MGGYYQVVKILTFWYTDCSAVHEQPQANTRDKTQICVSTLNLNIRLKTTNKSMHQTSNRNQQQEPNSCSRKQGQQQLSKVATAISPTVARLL